MPRLPKSLHILNRTLHIYLTMFALIMILFYSLTGLMLNHPDWFSLDNPRTVHRTADVPPALLSDRLLLVEHLRKHLAATGELSSFDDAEPETLRLQFITPGKKSDFVIQRPSGTTEISDELRGLSGLLADLHTGKQASFSWKRVIDATSLLLLLTSLTGIILWISLPKRRTLGLLALALSLALVAATYYFLL